MKDEHKTLTGEQYFSLTLTEVCGSFGVSNSVILEMVDEGIVSAGSGQASEWVFDDIAITRIRTALHLHRDLGVNWAGAALALELLEELRAVRRQLSSPG